ncbi:MAG: hypothetical protein Q9169_005634 [Polycauliona sp. 2 TL-2023]
MMAVKTPIRPTNDSMKSKKRKRAQNDTSQKQRKSPKVLGVNALPWNEVSFPANLDDAEGFFGLEEVSDVDIAKDETTGQVEFRHLKPPDAESQQGPIAEENDWNGCDDSDPGEGAAAPPKQPKPNVQEPPPKSNLNKSVQKGPIKPQGALLEANGFEHLRDDLDQEDDVSAWRSLDLSSQVLGSLAKLHFKEPTSIQRLAIPGILGGENIIGKASTGSGKTLAFGIPIVEHILEHGLRTDEKRHKDIEERKDPPTALILSPTRELAHQLSKHLEALCSNITPKSPQIATITGGLAPQKQQRKLANADIIIGTPGRLWEILSSSKSIMTWIRRIKFLVLDEADRLLTEGHFKELEEILDALKKIDATNDQNPSNPITDRQTLSFSATFSPKLNHKLSGHLKASATSSNSLEPLLSRITFSSPPRFIDASPTSHLPTSLKSYLLTCHALEKDLYLYALLLTHFPTARTLVFANSIHAVRRLVPFLQNLDLQVYGLHSQMPQKARMRSIERFTADHEKSSKNKTAKKANILVATDVAARGLDIPSVAAVIHYHLPTAANTYVHRSGRTARKGNAGISVLMCAPNEVQGTRRLVAKVYAKINDDDDDNTTIIPSVSSKDREQGLQTLTLNPSLTSRLKPRTTLAKRIATAETAKQSTSNDENWLRTAAEELGAEYDSEDFTNVKKGKGKKRRQGEVEMGKKGKAEVGSWKAELRELLGRRVNVGVSERYLSAGGIDVEALLEEGVGGGEFLGTVEGM